MHILCPFLEKLWMDSSTPSENMLHWQSSDVFILREEIKSLYCARQRRMANLCMAEDFALR